MRSHLLRSFLTAYIILTVLGGGVSYLLLQSYMRQQAESSASSLANVLTSGGFSDSAHIRQRMSELTGYEFEVLLATPQADLSLPPGSVGEPFPGGMLVVYYQTPEYETACTVLVTIAIVILGIPIFALVAWRIQALGDPPTLSPIGYVNWWQWLEAVPIVAGMRYGVLPMTRKHAPSSHGTQSTSPRCRTASGLGTFTATIAHEVAILKRIV